jgi:hypothetical protein
MGQPPDGLSLDSEVEYNPVFNFPPDFISNLHALNQLELAQSVPYISITLLDNDGQKLQNLNLNFFNKIIDHQKLNRGVRFGDRPEISLKDLTIEVLELSGYIPNTKVTLNLKIHSPGEITNTALQQLLYSGAPIVIEYGWNSSRSSFLTFKDSLLMNVSTYDLSYDTTGQMDLSVVGFALNDRFNNVLIGDEGVDFNTPANQQKDSLSKGKGDIVALAADTANAMGAFKQAIERGSAFRSSDVAKGQSANLEDVEKRARVFFAKNVARNMKAVSDATFNTQVFGGNHQAAYFHDILENVCGNTLSSLGGSLIGVQEVQIIYGRFNERAGAFAGQSIAGFPILYKKLQNFLNKSVKNGSFVPTMGRLLNYFAEEFLEFEKYFRVGLPRNAPDESFVMPDIVYYGTNREINGRRIYEIYIIDIKYKVPVTSLTYHQQQRHTKQEFEDAVAGGNNLAIIRLGHANSFIKGSSLNNTVDSQLKALKMVDMMSARIDGPRSTKLIEKSRDEGRSTPILFPIRGKLTVLGHPHWRPYRFFYLDTGIYFLDGVYKIIGLTHRLSSEGFTTDLDIMYN